MKKPALKTHFTPEKFAELARAAKIEAKFGGTLKSTKKEKDEALERLKRTAPVPILDHFSIEQRAQIRRLSRAGDFEGTTEAQATDETIAWLAEAALYVFGLDPIARRAFDRVSEAAGTNEVDDDTINAIINEMQTAGEAWTQRRRDNEREAALKGRAA
jgi:hypothetical protein